MVNAPFSLSYNGFDLAKHLAGYRADGLAKLRHGCRGVPIGKVGEEIPVKLRLQSAAGLQGVQDAGRCCFPEGSPDGKPIIPRKRRIVHTVDDVPVVILPVGQCLPGCQMYELIRQTHRRIREIGILQHLLNRRQGSF